MTKRRRSRNCKTSNSLWPTGSPVPSQIIVARRWLRSATALGNDNSRRAQQLTVNGVPLIHVSPMRETLASICDFDQINDSTHVQFAVTATDVQTGDQVSFANFVANPDFVHYVTPRISRVSLTPDHILASGSLPPAFPMTVVDGVPYWDGGLFDNTPIEPLLDLLTEDELENLPIFVVNLFATHSDPPANLRQVQERMLEISFESRFLLAHADASGSLKEFTQTVEEIMRDLPQDSPVRRRESFRRLIRFRALKNMRVIEAEHAPMTGGMDFSADGVRTRYHSGYAAVDKLLARTTP